MSTYTIPLSNPVGTAVFVDTASTNVAVAVFAGAGTVYQVDIDNSNNSGAVYVKLWNVASGSVTVGTTAPNAQFRCPGGERKTFTYGPDGVAFSTAITLATTTDAGTAGNSAPSQNVTVQVHI